MLASIKVHNLQIYYCFLRALGVLQLQDILHLALLGYICKAYIEHRANATFQLKAFS